MFKRGRYAGNLSGKEKAIAGISRTLWTLGRLKDENGKPAVTRALCVSKNNYAEFDPPALRLKNGRNTKARLLFYDITTEWIQNKLNGGGRMATITFSQGQFFHPYYGWFDKEPDLPNYAHRSGLVNEKIGPEHMITPDHPLYETSQKNMKSILEQSTQGIIQNEIGPRTLMRTDLATGTTTEYTEPAYVYEQKYVSKMAQILAEAYDPVTGSFKTAVYEETPAAVYEQRDLSYYLDGSTKFAGSYAFVYEGNTMTAKVNFQPRGSDPIDVVAHYEEHRANIQNLKKQGFHDDTINMLMKALDEAFVNAQSGGFEGRLLHFDKGMSSDQTKGVVKAFYEEYLRVRGSASSMENAMITAGNNLKAKGLFDAWFDVTTPKVAQSQKEIDANKIASAALKNLSAQGWPEFSLYSSENRAMVAKDDPWYAMVSEDALYWQSKPHAYEHW